MSCKYQKQARYHEERIRYLEQELKVAREEIIFLKAGNSSSKIKDQDISDNLRSWTKPKNSKSRPCSFSTDDASHVQLRNRFSVLEVDQQSTGLLKHGDNKIKPLARKTKSQKRKILLLGSSHGREVGPMLQEHLGNEYAVTSIFKPNAPLPNVVEDLRKLGKDFTK
jgi:hypothetical protein